MASAVRKLDQRISEAEYFAFEKKTDIRHEFVDGYVYAMVGGSFNHGTLTGTIARKIGNHLEGKPCRVFSESIKVKVANQQRGESRYFYPDVVVDCSDLPDDSTFTVTPVLLVEVISKSTRRIDETVKRAAYTQISTLQEYVLIEQDFVKIELIRRRAGWLPERYYLGDVLELESIGLSLPVELIYDRVQNEEMQEWLIQQREAAEAEKNQAADE